MNFFRLSQMEGETVTQYVARLRSHAVLCQFKIACTEHLRQIFINYTDDMVTQQLISGLRNQNHQSRILSEAAALPTLQQKIDRLQCLESTEQSTGLMQSSAPTTPSNNTPIKSSYRRRQNQQQPTRTPCKGCGGLSHENGKKRLSSNKQKLWILWYQRAFPRCMQKKAKHSRYSIPV